MASSLLGAAKPDEMDSAAKNTAAVNFFSMNLLFVPAAQPNGRHRGLRGMGLNAYCWRRQRTTSKLSEFRTKTAQVIVTCHNLYEISVQTPGIQRASRPWAGNGFHLDAKKGPILRSALEGIPEPRRCRKDPRRQTKDINGCQCKSPLDLSFCTDHRVAACRSRR